MSEHNQFFILFLAVLHSLIVESIKDSALHLVMPSCGQHSQIHACASIEIVVLAGEAEATEDNGVLIRKVVGFVLEEYDTEVSENLAPCSNDVFQVRFNFLAFVCPLLVRCPKLVISKSDDDVVWLCLLYTSPSPRDA